jgi:hypothetical protein
MAGESYDGGISRAAKWAVVAAAAVGLPTFALLLMLDALGDCEPGSDCYKGFLPMVLAPSALLAVLVGLLVWFLARKLGDRS